MSTTETEVLDLRDYELVYILQPEISEEAILGLNERLSQVVTDQQGVMTTTELWGRRTLAYPINKMFEGHYVLHRFQMAPGGTSEIDRLLRFNEDVVRYLLVRTDEN